MEGVKMVQENVPIYRTVEMGDVKLKDMPFTPTPKSQKIMKQFLDITDDWEQAFNVNELRSVMREKKNHDLPEPLKTKDVVHFGYTMQIVIAKKANGKFLIIKHVTLVDKKKHSVIEDKMVQGSSYSIQRCPDYSRSAPVFQILLEDRNTTDEHPA